MFTKIDVLAASKCSFVVPWGYGIAGEGGIGRFFFSAFMHLGRLSINKKVNYKLNYEYHKSLQIIHISRFRIPSESFEGVFQATGTNSPPNISM